MACRCRIMVSLLATTLVAATFGELGALAQPPAAAPAHKTFDLGPDGETLITLHLKDALPEDAFSALAQQAGVRFTSMPDTLWDQKVTPITIDIDKQPFWTAVQELSAKTGLALAQGTVPRRFAIYEIDPAWMKVRAYTMGGFWMQPSTVSNNRQINVARPDQPSGEQVLRIAVRADPNIKVLSSDDFFTPTEATDNLGHSLIPHIEGGPPGGLNSFNRNLHMWSMQCLLDLPPRNQADKIAILKGNMKVSIQTKSELADFDLASGKDLSKTIGDFAISINDLAKTDTQVTFKVDITMSKAPPKTADPLQEPTYLAIHSAVLAAQLLDDQGKEIPVLDTSTYHGGNHFTFTLTCGQRPAPGRRPRRRRRRACRPPGQPRPLQL